MENHTTEYEQRFLELKNEVELKVLKQYLKREIYQEDFSFVRREFNHYPKSSYHFYYDKHLLGIIYFELSNKSHVTFEPTNTF